MNTLSLVNNEDIFKKKGRELSTKQLAFYESLEEDWLKFVNSPIFGNGNGKKFPVMDAQERSERLKKKNKINETQNHFHQHTAEDLKEIDRLFSNPELEDLIDSLKVGVI